MSNSIASWVPLTTNGGFDERYYHSSVVLPNSTILIMGGFNATKAYNDVWKSTDNGVNWTLVRASCEWEPRYGHSSVVLSDGTIIIMGGRSLSSVGYYNDVWKSNNEGNTWTKINTGTMWTEREGHSTVVLSNNTIILMGGYSNINRINTFFNDVWQSTNGGINWTKVVENAQWSRRSYHTSVVLKDNTILLFNGQIQGNFINDIWVSNNNGASWNTLPAPWEIIGNMLSVCLSNDTIYVFGGQGNNKAWISKNKGNNWEQIFLNNYPIRNVTTSVVLKNDKIIIIGGFNISGGFNFYNDVWIYDTFSFSYTISSSPFLINSTTQNIYTTIPNNQLSVNINIPSNLQNYINDNNKNFQIKLFKNSVLNQTINTKETISFPFNDYSSANWKINTSIDIVSQSISQEIPFTFTGFKPLEPFDVSYSAINITNTTYDYEVFFKYDRRLNNADTNYPLPEKAIFNTIEYTLTQVSDIDGLYVFKFTVPNNTSVSNGPKQLTLKTGTLTNTPVEFDILFNFLNDIVNPTYSYRYTTSPVQSFVDISFQYNNQYGINKIIYQLDGYADVIVLTDVYSIPDISFSVPNNQYSLAFTTAQIQFERFGERNNVQTILKINVPPMNDFDLQVTSTFDGTNHNVAIQTLNTPIFTNAIYEIIDISRIEVMTPSYTFVFPTTEHFGKPMDISATLYKVNLNVAKTEHSQIAPYIKPTIQFVDFIQSFDYLNNKIQLKLDVANPSTTLLDVSYTLFQDGTKIANTESNFATLFSSNQFLYEISTDVENIYSLPFSIDIFFIESTGVPKEYSRFGIGGEIETTPLTRPARPTQFTASERFEIPTLYIDASFVASSQFNKIRLVIDASGVSGVYNDYPTFTNQGTYYDLSVNIPAIYLGRNIDLFLKVIDVNETFMSSDVITTKINATEIKSPFVNILDTSYVYLNNTTTFRLQLSGDYTSSDTLRYYVKKYDANHDLIDVSLNTNIPFTNTLIISLATEQPYTSSIYGFFYEIGVNGRKSNLPNEDRFYSDITSTVLLPNITPITISNVSVLERYINETVFDVSFTIANIPNTDYTFFDISLLDGTTVLYNQRIFKNEFVQTGNVIHKQIELAGSEHFGKQLILQYSAKYLNDPYKKVIPINYQIDKIDELKLVSFDASMNIKGNTLIFNIVSSGERTYINGDKLKFEILDGTTTIFSETNPFTTSLFYVGTPPVNKYGTALIARCTWIPLYYPIRPEWNDSIKHTFSTTDYAIDELKELNGILEVNENTGRIEYTPILKFAGPPSLTHIDDIVSFNYPQVRSNIISNDYQVRYDICANGVLLQSVIQDGSGNLIQDGTQYRGDTFNYDLTNFGKIFTIKATYSLKNTTLETSTIQTIDSGTRPEAPLSISLIENYSFTPDLSYGFAFEYEDFEFSSSLDFVYLAIYNVTKSQSIFNDKISFKDLIKTNNTYTLDFQIQGNPAFYNDILDVSCEVEHFTLISNPRTKRIQNTLEPPYDLNAIAILNVFAAPSVAYEISNVTFLHDGKGVPPFASVSYELIHLTDNTLITNGIISYNDLVKSGTGVVSYRFPNAIGIDAVQYYLDPMRLNIQLIYENLITLDISYSGFNFTNNPTKPDILGAKYNPSIEHIHITFQHPEDSQWHFSNVVLYVEGSKVYDANYRLKTYASPFTNKLIDFDINDIITDRIYSLDVSLNDVDISVRADIQAGNKQVDVCLNVITDLIGSGTISLKASEYDSLTDDLVFDIEFQNLFADTSSLQYHDFKITYNVVPPEEQEFISEYVLYFYSSSVNNEPVDTSYSIWKTIEVNDYPEVSFYLDGTDRKLIPNDYYWFKIIGKHGTSLSSTLADSSNVSFQVPNEVLDLVNAEFDFGHEIRKNILAVDVSFTLDVTPVRENMNIILDISGFNNQVRPTDIYDGVLIPIEFPVELPTLTPKIYIYNDWKQNISVSAAYKNVELKTLDYVIETPITLEDITAVAVRNGLYKTTYVIQWKKILLTAEIEIYSYIVENILLSYEEALLIPFNQYTLFGTVTTFQSSFSFNQPRMREIPIQTQVIRFRAVYNPESELSEPLVFYQTNCGYPTLITPETNPKKAIVNKPQFTKKELYAKGFRGRLF